MGSESTAHVFLIKSNWLVKNIETNNFSQQKSDSAAMDLVFKAGAFRYWWAITYSLVIAKPIRMQY